ncbi:hypothetical protein VOLCADRAFT_104589 [Volvox carteri f. nagariensis]|uniref:Ion transport domain-containing protein n=1 Tax=Volvox carteri f. nagariensis TaxID=3068 RepID=D8TUN8_VOLCA|nr:uncharacterized protein VOLCADRAFT_104589 [Volvox carteri f. nagariensis]EFJ48740.1 hypothetical protein VOLCADRAFT_104589 [Volvox carteri f. nagariensis]|eukprot:XP_002950072.1 hypothetical protein VOLCADRAFT_104589 [Volvox carteri f. nagariensis]
MPGDHREGSGNAAQAPASARSFRAKDVETAAEAGNEGFADVFSGPDMAGMGIKIQAIESLAEPTRRFLHINILGKPLPTWMIWDKQPKLNRFNYLMSRLHTFMTDANSSVYAAAVSQFMVASIIISVLSFCLETIPSFQSHRAPVAARVFTWVEAVTIQIFALDYLLRFISAPVKLKFTVDPFNIIDLIAIVPWYIITWVGTDFNGTTVFRVVRLLRVFRVLKLGGRYSKLLVVLHSLRKSLDMLGLMAFFISLCIVFFATLMYYAERGSYDEQLGELSELDVWVPMRSRAAALGNRGAGAGYYVRPYEVQMIDYGVPKPSPFESIVSGFWWAIVTIMTVGYGDTFPVTAGGKAIACVTMICGILTLALPISVIGATFTNDWEAHVVEEKRRITTNKKITITASPLLLQLQRLLNRHLEDAETLIMLNRNSEVALEEASSELHHTLKSTKKHLHTEAKADLRLRRNALRNRTAMSADNTPYDQQYGYLPMDHVKEKYREQLEAMSEAAGSLGRRACHVTRMEAVNMHLVDRELEAIVARLAKKHADLAFLLAKHEEKPSPLALLEAELADLKGYVEDCRAANATALSKGPRAHVFTGSSTSKSSFRIGQRIIPLSSTEGWSWLELVGAGWSWLELGPRERVAMLGFQLAGATASLLEVLALLPGCAQQQLSFDNSRGAGPLLWDSTHDSRKEFDGGAPFAALQLEACGLVGIFAPRTESGEAKETGKANTAAR